MKSRLGLTAAAVLAFSPLGAFAAQAAPAPAPASGSASAPRTAAPAVPQRAPTAQERRAFGICVTLQRSVNHVCTPREFKQIVALVQDDESRFFRSEVARQLEFVEGLRQIINPPKVKGMQDVAYAATVPGLRPDTDTPEKICADMKRDTAQSCSASQLRDLKALHARLETMTFKSDEARMVYIMQSLETIFSREEAGIQATRKPAPRAQAV